MLRSMAYELIKTVHIASAALSYAGFVLRGAWMWAGSPLLKARLTRVLPHIVDTILLLSAIYLAVSIRQYPFQANWLTAKVLALVLYIGLGMATFRGAVTKPQRIAAWVAAQGVFLYIVLVAITKRPFVLA